ncbi:MAG: ATP-binding protein [Chloroflexota bacterium]
MKTTRLEIKSDYANIRTADQALRDMLEKQGVKEEVIGVCELASHELLNNIVDHAYVDNPAGVIQITLTIDHKTLEIRTEDDGLPSTLDLSAVTMPDPLDLMEGGYGLAIMLSQMDSVNYSIENGKNVWKLQKTI